VLTDVSLFLPAHETTFIVGGSGSGKSTIAQLLLRMYVPQDGCVMLDDQDMGYLDEVFMRENLVGVSQGCILFDRSVHDNVAMGRLRRHGDGEEEENEVSREEVVDACRAALMHEFVRDLPEGYDTRLGNGGANLSGGQKQRLAIARAKLRDPSVLILGGSPISLPLWLLDFKFVARQTKRPPRWTRPHECSSSKR
jgi:ATP-binding cassette subfamily B (MDR/TAP) protein 1